MWKSQVLTFGKRKTHSIVICINYWFEMDLVGTF